MHQMFSVHTTREEFENGGFTLKMHLFSVHTTREEFENGGFTLKTHQMFSVHTTREEFENGGFTLKTHQMFSSTIRRRNLTSQQSPIILDLFEEDSGLKITWYRVNVAFEKLRFHDGIEPVQTSSEEFQWPRSFISKVRRTVHTNPSRKQSL